MKTNLHASNVQPRLLLKGEFSDLWSFWQLYKPPEKSSYLVCNIRHSNLKILSVYYLQYLSI